ncbi:MAG: RNA 2',3'-cyclic phosphodiesterase [Candidatus Binataceae bacterium]
MDLRPKIRAFVALRFGADIDRALVRLIDELRVPGDGISWSRATNLHLTLRFLGPAVDSRLLAPMAQSLRAVSQHSAPFVVLARGIGAFPDLARPRVIWVGLESEELIRLACEVEAVAVRTGFAPERRPFSPHLTLGRVKSLKGWARLRAALEAASGRDFGPSRIDSMALYESRLSPQGSIYREIERFAFAAAG